MAYVVTAPCFGCKYTDCVVVCPAECFHEGEQMLYIDPESCLDCDACRPECPVDAIYRRCASRPARHRSLADSARRPACVPTEWLEQACTADRLD